VCDTRLRVDVERADPLVLWRQPLAGRDLRGTVRPFGPPQMPLSPHDGAFDERTRERDKVGDELVEGFRPAALSKLVVDLDLHAVDRVLRGLHNLESVLLRDQLFELCHLRLIRGHAGGLNHTHNLLRKAGFQLRGLVW